MFDKDKIFKITEMSRITGYDKHVLRYYEKEFDIDVPRNNAKHRYYTHKEVELYQRIKSLQEQGFTNKQIKLILNTPEVKIDGNSANEETAVSTATASNVPASNQIKDLSNLLRNEVKELLVENEKRNQETINILNVKIDELTSEIRSKERDILISENAKLKMKFKAKSYEVADLREKLKKAENKKGFFRKLFS